MQLLFSFLRDFACFGSNNFLLRRSEALFWKYWDLINLNFRKCFHYIHCQFWFNLCLNCGFHHSSNFYSIHHLISNNHWWIDYYIIAGCSCLHLLKCSFRHLCGMVLVFYRRNWCSLSYLYVFLMLTFSFIYSFQHFCSPFFVKSDLPNCNSSILNYSIAKLTYF